MPDALCPVNHIFMKIATWNINSVRLRLPQVLRFLKEHKPDALCLQETKCPDDAFPKDAFIDAGYNHIHINGMKSYNGVAIISKHELSSPDIHSRVGKNDCRHISATLKDIRVHCLYVPAGGDIPDINTNEKFKHKLDLIDELTAWFPKMHKKNDAALVLGDFNIAPLEHDVWSHKQLLDVVSHTPIEVEKLKKFLVSLNWTDGIRLFVPEQEKCYTWWSYRNQDWQKSNRGRRLDHIWVTDPLKSALKSYDIFKETRSWTQPSDHVPVMVTLKI